MNLKSGLDKGETQKVLATWKALGDLPKLVESDIRNSQVKSFSADRRFATAYIELSDTVNQDPELPAM